MPDHTADPTLDRLLRHMAWANAAVIATLAGLTDAALALAAPQNEWTVAMILEHLVTAADGYGARLEGEPRPDAGRCHRRRPPSSPGSPRAAPRPTRGCARGRRAGRTGGVPDRRPDDPPGAVDDPRAGDPPRYRASGADRGRPVDERDRRHRSRRARRLGLQRRRGTRGVARSDEVPPTATAPDAVGRLAALGRAPADRELLTQALRELDARYALVAKIAAEPGVETIVAEFVSRLIDAFGDLSALGHRTVLDLPSGSNSSRSPVTGKRTAEFEPWMCRLLLGLGARPVGIDIGDLTGEAFEHHNVDLGVPRALDFLPSASFDAIHESRLFGSPEFRAAYGRATDRIRAEIHGQEQRLLRPGGILIHSDGRAAGRPGALS